MSDLMEDKWIVISVSVFNLLPYVVCEIFKENPATCKYIYMRKKRVILIPFWIILEILLSQYTKTQEVIFSWRWATTSMIFTCSVTLRSTSLSCSLSESFIHIPFCSTPINYLENITSLSCAGLLNVDIFYYIILKKLYCFRNHLVYFDKMSTKHLNLNNHNFACQSFFQVQIVFHE